MTYKGTFPYPPMFEVLADELAEVRSILSADIYKEGTEKFRGSREHEISKLGILGELIARDYLSLRPINFKCAKLIDVKPVVEPDIILTDVAKFANLDVKCVKLGGKYFNVNYDAFNNENKKVDVYWFVRLERNYEASHYLYTDVEVKRDFKVVDLTYTKAYSIDAPTL